MVPFSFNVQQRLCRFSQENVIYTHKLPFIQSLPCHFTCRGLNKISAFFEMAQTLIFLFSDSMQLLFLRTLPGNNQIRSYLPQNTHHSFYQVEKVFMADMSSQENGHIAKKPFDFITKQNGSYGWLLIVVGTAKSFKS